MQCYDNTKFHLHSTLLRISLLLKDEIDRLKDLLKEKQTGKDVQESVEVGVRQEAENQIQKLQEERDASLAEKQRYEEALKKQEADLEEYSKKLEDEKIQQEELRKKILEMESKVGLTVEVED